MRGRKRRRAGQRDNTREATNGRGSAAILENRAREIWTTKRTRTIPWKLAGARKR